MSAQDDVRHDVRAWLAEHWDPDAALLDWRRQLVDSGWATPTWPTDWYGRGLPAGPTPSSPRSSPAPAPWVRPWGAG